MRWLALLLCLGCAVHADEAPRYDGAADLVADIFISLAPLPAIRPHAPVAVHCRMWTRGAEIRTGRLRLSVREGQSELATWRSEELVASSSIRRSTVMLPPLPIAAQHAEVTVDLAWEESDGQVSAPVRRTLVLPEQGETRILALCAPVRLDGSALPPLASDHYRPDGEERGSRVTRLRIALDELPDDALAWCAYDVAAIVGENLAAIDDEHVAALEGWVRAGGSALLVITEPPGPAIAALIARAASGSAALDDGRLRAPLGLGRLMVTHAHLAESDPGRWREDLAFVWRDDGAQAVDTDRAQRLVGYHDAALHATLVDLLWPDEVAVMPLWLIVALFVGFIALIGPGDWFLLGRIRRRHWTWLTFPAVTVLCTWGMVRLSEHYLGGGDQVHGLDISDVGPGGAQLRRNRLELVFSGRTQRVERDGSRGWWAELHEASQRNANPWAAQQETTTPRQPPLYDGSLPRRYAVHQMLRQWTPVLQRRLEFGGDRALPWAVDLDAIATRDDARRLAPALAQAMGDGAWIAVIGDGAVEDLVGREADFTAGRVRAARHYYSDAVAHGLTYELTALPAGAARGSLSGPAGGADVRDLRLIDLGRDAGGFVLILGQRRGDDIVVVRRCYPGPSQGAR
ncbi:MAG TPA: hypothetical protein VEL07_05810 [Planctomycetota bacterium]|nr:hypothetical protein [Planctomycetota bacterium]